MQRSSGGDLFLRNLFLQPWHLDIFPLINHTRKGLSFCLFTLLGLFNGLVLEFVEDDDDDGWSLKGCGKCTSSVTFGTATELVLSCN